MSFQHIGEGLKMDKVPPDIGADGGKIAALKTAPTSFLPPQNNFLPFQNRSSSSIPPSTLPPPLTTYQSIPNKQVFPNQQADQQKHLMNTDPNKHIINWLNPPTSFRSSASSTSNEPFILTGPFSNPLNSSHGSSNSVIGYQSNDSVILEDELDEPPLPTRDERRMKHKQSVEELTLRLKSTGTSLPDWYIHLEDDDSPRQFIRRRPRKGPGAGSNNIPSAVPYLKASALMTHNAQLNSLDVQNGHSMNERMIHMKAVSEQSGDGASSIDESWDKYQQSEGYPRIARIGSFSSQRSQASSSRRTHPFIERLRRGARREKAENAVLGVQTPHQRDASLQVNGVPGWERKEVKSHVLKKTEVAFEGQQKVTEEVCLAASLLLNRPEEEPHYQMISQVLPPEIEPQIEQETPFQTQQRNQLYNEQQTQFQSKSSPQGVIQNQPLLTLPLTDSSGIPLNNRNANIVDPEDGGLNVEAAELIYSTNDIQYPPHYQVNQRVTSSSKNDNMSHPTTEKDLVDSSANKALPHLSINSIQSSVYQSQSLFAPPARPNLYPLPPQQDFSAPPAIPPSPPPSPTFQQSLPPSEYPPEYIRSMNLEDINDKNPVVVHQKTDDVPLSNKPFNPLFQQPKASEMDETPRHLAQPLSNESLLDDPLPEAEWKDENSSKQGDLFGSEANKCHHSLELEAPSQQEKAPDTPPQFKLIDSIDEKEVHRQIFPIISHPERLLSFATPCQEMHQIISQSKRVNFGKELGNASVMPPLKDRLATSDTFTFGDSSSSVRQCTDNEGEYTNDFQDSSFLPQFINSSLNHTVAYSDFEGEMVNDMSMVSAVIGKNIDLMNVEMNVNNMCTEIMNSDSNPKTETQIEESYSAVQEAEILNKSSEERAGLDGKVERFGGDGGFEKSGDEEGGRFGGAVGGEGCNDRANGKGWEIFGTDRGVAEEEAVVGNERDIDEQRGRRADGMGETFDQIREMDKERIVEERDIVDEKGNVVEHNGFVVSLPGAGSGHFKGEFQGLSVDGMKDNSNHGAATTHNSEESSHLLILQSKEESADSHIGRPDKADNLDKDVNRMSPGCCVSNHETPKNEVEANEFKSGRTHTNISTGVAGNHSRYADRKLSEIDRIWVEQIERNNQVFAMLGSNGLGHINLDAIDFESVSMIYSPPEEIERMKREMTELNDYFTKDLDANGKLKMPDWLDTIDLFAKENADCIDELLSDVCDFNKPCFTRHQSSSPPDKHMLRPFVDVQASTLKTNRSEQIDKQPEVNLIHSSNHNVEFNS